MARPPLFRGKDIVMPKTCIKCGLLCNGGAYIVEGGHMCGECYGAQAREELESKPRVPLPTVITSREIKWK